jgi:hypothetical protein
MESCYSCHIFFNGVDNEIGSWDSPEIPREGVRTHKRLHRASAMLLLSSSPGLYVTSLTRNFSLTTSPFA